MFSANLNREVDYKECKETLAENKGLITGLQLLEVDTTKQRGFKCGYYSLSAVMGYWHKQSDHYPSYAARAGDVSVKTSLPSLSHLGKERGLLRIGCLFNSQNFGQLLHQTEYKSITLMYQSLAEMNSHLERSLLLHLPVIIGVDMRSEGLVFKSGWNAHYAIVKGFYKTKERTYYILTSNQRFFAVADQVLFDNTNQLSLYRAAWYHKENKVWIKSQTDPNKPDCIYLAPTNLWHMRNRGILVVPAVIYTIINQFKLNHSLLHCMITQPELAEDLAKLLAKPLVATMAFSNQIIRSLLQILRTKKELLLAKTDANYFSQLFSILNWLDPLMSIDFQCLELILLLTPSQLQSVYHNMSLLKANACLTPYSANRIISNPDSEIGPSILMKIEMIKSTINFLLQQISLLRTHNQDRLSTLQSNVLINFVDFLKSNCQGQDFTILLINWTHYYEVSFKINPLLLLQQIPSSAALFKPQPAQGIQLILRALNMSGPKEMKDHLSGVESHINQLKPQFK